MLFCLAAIYHEAQIGDDHDGHSGHDVNGEMVNIEKLPGKKIIKEALNENAYILVPNLAEMQNAGDKPAKNAQNIRSAMAAPVAAPAGAYGVIYVDNAEKQKPYHRADLDYLSIIGALVAAMAEHVA